MEKEIVGYKSGCCPNCGEEIEEYDSNTIDGFNVVFYFSCPKCGGAGAEIWEMSYSESNVLIEK